jgi:LmbE family N-acetylglucosaminyl deacetylase
VAHPDDESFGLGAVLDAFGRAGAVVDVLCLTRGEASTLHGVSGDLSELRAAELRTAAEILGVRNATLKGHRDGDLGAEHRAAVAEVLQAATTADAEGIVVMDTTGITGHPDHVAATAAALAAAEVLDLPVLGWTLPASVAEALNDEFDGHFFGRPATEIDIRLEVTRDLQRRASLAHASQAVPTSVLWRRLELLGDVEHLRWLRAPNRARPSVR